MPVVLDTNMKLIADRMNITSSRMIEDYGLKTVEEIIEAEAEKGNMQAVKYAQEVFDSPQKLIDAFKLNDIENKFVILHNMNEHTRLQVLPLLDKEDLVMGMYFFTKDKLLDIMTKVDMKELVSVILAAFPIEQIMMMFTEEDLALFFQSDEIEKEEIVKQLKNLPEDIMKKFVEGVTGLPSDQTNPFELISSIEALPEDQFKDFMSCIDPDVQRQLVFQLTKEDPKYLQLFQPIAYINMLSTLMKQDMVKPMIALKKDTLLKKIAFLPSDLMSIVGAQIDTKKFAEFLINGHLEVLKRSMMI